MKNSSLLFRALLMVMAILLVVSGCRKKQEEDATKATIKKESLNMKSEEKEIITPSNPPLITFGDDLDFLIRHTEVVVLSDSTGQAKLVTTPAWQGRVMTSAAEGEQGLSFGWINRDLIKSGEVQEHINVYGGEDRLWLGPEGGQFSIFFKGNDPFDLDHWYVPAVMDTEAFETVETDRNRILFRKKAVFSNYSGFTFDVELTREVKILEGADIAAQLGIDIPDSIHQVGYVTINTLTNTGDSAWSKKTGCLSIWTLGMFNPSPQTTIAIPFVEGDAADLGPVVNDAYFGKVPDERLHIEEGLIYFKGDGLFRSKIGVTPHRSKPILGSYDAGNKVLTIVIYTKPKGAVDYVNSMWELQDDPFAGDAVNSYNDGPPEPGAKPLGPFYELETSSPAAALEPGKSQTHENRTFHFQGTESELNKISLHCLGVSLAKIKSALK